MAEAVIEKAVCFSCGADVREGTAFCYACGKPVANGSGDLDIAEDTVTEPIAVEDEVAVEKPSEREIDRSEKLAAAAAERKKSRVGQRKPKKVIWEEPSATTNRVFVLICLLISVIAGALVFLMVFVK